MTQIHVSSSIKILLILFFLLSFSISYAQFAGGSGTEADPYLVETAQHLNNVRNYDNSCFRQIADINLGVAPYNQGEGWNAIGGHFSWEFRGKFHGGNHSISNLFINSTWSQQGLFRATKNAVLDSIILDNVLITGGPYIGGLVGYMDSTSVVGCQVSGIIGIANSMEAHYYGGLVGICVSNSSIVNCSTSGFLYGAGYFGGIVGDISSSVITNCSSSMNLQGSGFTSCIGGLVGNAANITISQCIATGGIIAGSYSSCIGGLIGAHSGNTSISNCYSTGNVAGYNDTGGLIGNSNQGLITNCYATGAVTGGSWAGGLIGSGSESTIFNCYWDIQTSGQTTSDGGEGRTTDDMTYPYADNTYMGWDFNTVWLVNTSGTINNGYPILTSNLILYTVSPPTFSLEGGQYSTPIHLTIGTAALNTQIYYTLDGSEPTELSIPYSAPIAIDSTTTIKAKAYKQSWLPSLTVAATYVIRTAAPVFSPESSSFSQSIQVTLQTETVDAVIYYTLDGSDPTEQSLLFSNPIDIDTTTTIKARAYKAPMDPSEIVTAVYTQIVSNDDQTTPHLPSYCYPNPFKTSTSIQFDLPKSDKINLSIYNTKGQLIKTLSNNYLIKGEHNYEWNGCSDNGKAVPSGVYVYKLKGKDFEFTRKMTLMK